MNIKYNRRHYERLRDTEHAEELVHKLAFETLISWDYKKGEIDMEYLKNSIRAIIFSYLDVVKVD